jgi:catechol 2,3-dioxygenase-like lactoylglutathione lyase family enzyme
MTIQRMDHVGVVVDDPQAAIAFFVELGMELEGEAPIEGRWVDRVNGLDGVRVDIAMMRNPGRPRPARADEVPYPDGGPEGIIVALAEELS